MEPKKRRIIPGHIPNPPGPIERKLTILKKRIVPGIAVPSGKPKRKSWESL